MPRIHPRLGSARELAGHLSAGQRRLLRHAVACPACRVQLLALLAAGEKTGDADDAGGTARILAWPAETGTGTGEHVYAAVIDGILARCQPKLEAIAREQAAAPALVAELLRHPHERRRLLVAHRPRLVSLPVVDHLLQASREEGYGEPRAAEDLAVLAREITERLDVEAVGRHLVADTRARCWLAIANARRIAADLSGAEAALAEAERSLAEGSRDPLESARFFFYSASVRRARRRLTEAAHLLDRAGAIYRRARENQLAAEVTVGRAVIDKEMGFPERAIERLREAGGLIDPDDSNDPNAPNADPRLTLCIHHNWIDWLVDAGRPAEAEERMAQSAAVYRRFDDAPTRLRQAWVAGKIARGLGRFEAAAELFTHVHEGFQTLGLAYDTALAALDLAGVAAQLGRTADVQRLAAEMLPIFRSLDVHRETLAAVIVFQQAAAAERATLALGEELAAYLRRAAVEPGVPFEPE